MYRRFGVLGWMITNDPDILSVAISVIGHSADVGPKQGVSLRRRPHPLVDLQDYHRVIGDCFQYFHLLQSCCKKKKREKRKKNATLISLYPLNHLDFWNWSINFMKRNNILYLAELAKFMTDFELVRSALLIYDSWIINCILNQLNSWLSW